MAKFTDACAWIAYNDSPADGTDAESISGYISTLLVADVFHRSLEEVTRRIIRYRLQETGDASSVRMGH